MLDGPNSRAASSTEADSSGDSGRSSSRRWSQVSASRDELRDGRSAVF